MDLIAQGDLPGHRWRRPVPAGSAFLIGRVEPAWAASWDEHISRSHVRAQWVDGRLNVERLPDARNPIFVDGKEAERCALRPGEHFVIGQTTFTLADSQAAITSDPPQPFTQQQYKAEFLREIRYGDAEQRIDALSRLPDLIQGATNQRELFSRIVNVLLRGVPRCHHAAIVDAGDEQQDRPAAILHWDCGRHAQDDLHPSQQLIRQAVDRGETILHLWDEPRDDHAGFTQASKMDWAFCTPVAYHGCHSWALYLAGRFPTCDVTLATDRGDFDDDLKFAESVAAMLGNICEVKRLERRNAALSQFFPPVVLDMLASSADHEVVLAPREATVTVMFFDLRGFSLHAERSAGDLFGLLDRVSLALGMITRLIREHAGVVGDFQGDSVMGFWGWPLTEEDAPRLACQTAVAILQALQRPPGDGAVRAEPSCDEFGFGFGMGIATGKAVAGKIGTVDHFKVTVFGPVVNLASRLESMTQFWHANVLVDQQTADAVAVDLSNLPGRMRRLAAVQPYGMTTSVAIHELRLPASQDAAVSSSQFTTSQQCLEVIESQDWSTASELSERLVDDDPLTPVIRRLLKSQSALPQWDGILRMEAK